MIMPGRSPTFIDSGSYGLLILDRQVLLTQELLSGLERFELPYVSWLDADVTVLGVQYQLLPSPARTAWADPATILHISHVAPYCRSRVPDSTASRVSETYTQYKLTPRSLAAGLSNSRLRHRRAQVALKATCGKPCPIRQTSTSDAPRAFLTCLFPPQS